MNAETDYLIDQFGYTLTVPGKVIVAEALFVRGRGVVMSLALRPKVGIKEISDTLGGTWTYVTETATRTMSAYVYQSTPIQDGRALVTIKLDAPAEVIVQGGSLREPGAVAAKLW